MKREIYFLEQSDHQNIVKYYGYFPIDDNTTGLAMELCDGTLKDLVKARDLSMFEVAYLTLQMFLGIQYLHDDLRVHHRYKIHPEYF